MHLLQGKNQLQKVDWLRLVLDEGHTVRNPKTQMTKAVLELKAERKWIVTGELTTIMLYDIYLSTYFTMYHIVSYHIISYHIWICYGTPIHISEASYKVNKS